MSGEFELSRDGGGRLTLTRRCTAMATSSSGVPARPWVISGTQWTPTSAEAAMILKQIGDATETETAVVHGGPAPSLELTTFEIDGDALHVGLAGTLVVPIADHGPDTAPSCSPA
jgi:hypothetical protein